MKDRKKLPVKQRLRWVRIGNENRVFHVLLGTTPSFPEMKIGKILKDLGILYYREVAFTYGHRFDFYLPDFDAVIEYDGGQHSKRSERANDKIKNKILKDLGIRLVRYNRNSGDLRGNIRVSFLK